MAPRNTPGLNIGDTDQLLNLMGFQRPKTAAEIMQLYSQGIAGKGPLKDKFLSPLGRFKTQPGETVGVGILKDIGNLGLGALDTLRTGAGYISAFTDPIQGNIIGDLLSQESPEGFKKRVEGRDRTKDTVTGQEPFLPSMDRKLIGSGGKTIRDIEGMDIFTQAGQDRLQSEAAKAIQDTLAGSKPDARAFSAGDFADADTIAKIQKEVETDTSAPDQDIDYTDTFTDKDLETAADTGEGQALTNAQQATKSALDSFLKEARPGVSPKEYKDYIEEFGKATGLDISGDPDTKQALMSFGLALMQNRAGKGFNLSKILGSVGEAGEAAMPEFSKAVSEAKAIRAKAGAFALSRKKEDQAAAMNRGNYYIIPRGKTGGIKGLQENFEKGRNVMLNSFELNALNENAKFNEQFEIVPDAIYKKAAEAYFKTPEFGEKYMSKYTPISLFKDAPKDLQIDVANVNPNYKGPDAPKQGFFNVNQYDTYIQRLTRMDNGLNKIEKDLGKAYNIVKSGRVDAPGQIADSISSFAAAFGFQGGPDATDKAKVLYVLDSIAAKKAPQILGEAGKTISDADRERVKAIVGKLETFSDPRTLQLALKEVYELIVVEGKQDIRDGLTTLNRYSGKEKPVFENKYKGLKIGDDGIFNVSDEDD
jgi:hypothetical protein